jgi:hypothetical protein
MDVIGGALVFIDECYVKVYFYYIRVRRKKE